MRRGWFLGLAFLFLLGCKDDHGALRRERTELLNQIAVLEKIMNEARPRFHSMTQEEKTFYGRMDLDLRDARTRVLAIDEEVGR